MAEAAMTAVNNSPVMRWKEHFTERKVKHSLLKSHWTISQKHCIAVSLKSCTIHSQKCFLLVAGRWALAVPCCHHLVNRFTAMLRTPVSVNYNYVLCAALGLKRRHHKYDTVK